MRAAAWPSGVDPKTATTRAVTATMGLNLDFNISCSFSTGYEMLKELSACGYEVDREQAADHASVARPDAVGFPTRTVS
jgi:hypothetical protein